MSRLDEVHARRAALVLRAEAQRADLAQSLARLERPLLIVGRIGAAVYFVRTHPYVVALAVVAVLLVRRPRRARPVVAATAAPRAALLVWAERAFFLWRGYRNWQRISGALARAGRR